MKRRAFRIWACPGGEDCWRWECSLCHPPCHGARFGADAWARIVTISLPRHMRVRACHHAWVRRHA